MNDTVSHSKLVTRRQAAEVLGLRPQTLAAWSMTGKYGLPVVKVGRSVRYRLSDLEQWLASRTIGAVNSHVAEQR
jgi:excisionase family DNA binding protein